MMIVAVKEWKEWTEGLAAKSKQRWGQDYKHIADLVIGTAEIQALRTVKRQFNQAYEGLGDMLKERAAGIRRKGLRKQ